MPRSLWSMFLVASLGLATFAQERSPIKPGAVPSKTTAGVQPEHPSPPPADASPEQLEIRGDQLRETKAFNDAIDYFSAALKKRPSAAVLYNKRGIAYLEMGRYDLAQKDFQQAIKFDHAYPEAVNNLGVVYYQKKKYGKAIKLYEKAVELREATASFHSNLGTAFFAVKQYDKAAAEFLRALQIDPEVFDRQSRAGVGLRMASPEDRARFLYVMAKLYAQQGMYERSLQSLTKAIEGGYNGAYDAANDPDFAAMRKDPRFGSALADLMAHREPAPNETPTSKQQ